MKSKLRIISAMLAAAMLLGLAGCSGDKAAQSNDVLTQTVTSPNKTQLTILVKSAFSINFFEKAAEEKFPELDIIQVGNYSANMGIAEYEARLKHDDLTDIVMTWPLDVGNEYWEDRLIDLSSLPCTSLYTSARLDNISKDGKLYYLPGPSQIRGIVYNKTLFAENGWSVPTDFEGFANLCHQIEQTGIRSLQLGLGNDEVLDTAFVGYNLANFFSTPSDVQWLNDYNNGKGSFAEHFTPALDTFQRLIDEKILQPNDLNLTYSDREYMLFNRQCAMIEDSALIARMGESYNGCKDEFALMPFFNQSPDSDWARLYPVCYIGLNKHLQEPANKEKYELTLKLLDYISTPEGQLALAGDTGGMYSSLIGVPPPKVPEIADINDALAHGRCAVFPVLKNAQSALRLGLKNMILGKTTATEVAKAVDKQNKTPPILQKELVIGKALADFNMIETGSFITDAMRNESGCEIALFLDNGKDGKFNGKGINGSFYKGDITAKDLIRILPDYRMGEKGSLQKVTMTGESLLRTIEYSIPVDNNRTGWFYYFSGIKMEFDPAAVQGKRIGKITMENGDAFDPNCTYTVAIGDQSVPQDAIITCEETGTTIYNAIEKAITQEGVSPPKDGRFKIISANEAK